MRRKKGPGGPESEILILRSYEGNPRALVEQYGIRTFRTKEGTMRAFLTLATAVALFASVTPVVADQAEDEVAIRKVVEQFFAEANKHDIETVLALWVEDLENWTGSMKGHAAFKQYYTEFWGRNKDRQYRLLEEIGIVFVTPDVAIHKYHDEATGRLDADGKPLPPEKRLQALLLVKKEGKWLLSALFSRSIEE